MRATDEVGSGVVGGVASGATAASAANIPAPSIASIARSPLRHCWAKPVLANTILRNLGPGLDDFSDHIMTLTSRPLTETTSSIGFCRCSAAASIFEKRHISEQFMPMSILAKASSDGTRAPPADCVQFATSYSTMAPCGQCSSSSGYGGCMQTTHRFTAVFMPFKRCTATPRVHRRASRSSFSLNVVAFGRLARSRACSTTCSAGGSAPPARAAAGAAATTTSCGGGAVGLVWAPPSATCALVAPLPTGAAA